MKTFNARSCVEPAGGTQIERGRGHVQHKVHGADLYDDPICVPPYGARLEVCSIPMSEISATKAKALMQQKAHAGWVARLPF